MNNNIIFRKVQPTDAEQYIDLENLVWRDAYKHIFPEEVFLDKEKKRLDKIKKFSEIHCNNDKVMCYVAEENGKIVGFIYGNIKSDYEHFGNMNYADLVGLYIDPKYQGKGIASKLRSIFINWLKENSVDKYVIGVLEENFKARKVYEKWRGKLDTYTQLFYKFDVGYKEVFYTYKV